jgi:DNA-binding GntR family transcriptional regulator
VAEELVAKAKYMIIYEWLSEQIVSKKFLVGDKIPNENELAAMFGVHRMTVRQAINRLVDDHFLVRKRGKGTFLLSVQRPVLTRTLETISSYHDDIVKAGLWPSYKKLDGRIIQADADLATKLGLVVGADVVSLRRIMLASEIPLVLEESYLPADLFPNILNLSLEENLYNLMVSEFNMRLDCARTEIGAVMPTLEERHLLKLIESCPCLWVEGVVYNESGRIVEFSRALCRGDKYRFVCSIGQYVCDNLHGEAQSQLPRRIGEVSRP